MKNPFTTEFLLVVVFVIMVIGFIFFGATDNQFQKDTALAKLDAQTALQLANQTQTGLKELTITPTATPSATPSAVKVRTFTPVAPAKTATPVK